MSDTRTEQRKQFEQWYATNAFYYERDPIGSHECGLQWKSWQAAQAAAPVTPTILPDLMYRLSHHAADARNTAFSRSTMNELLQVLNFAQPAQGRQPIGWFVQGENTYLYTNTPEKPNFACINGGDKVLSIEPRYAYRRTDMTDQTRADFEAHFQLTTRQKWQHPDGSYKFPEIQAKWEGYQAGVAKAAPPEPVNGKEPAAYFWRDKVEGTVGLRFTMPEWVDSPDKQRYELVRLYAAPVAAAAPGAECKSCALLRRYEKTARERGYAMGKAAGNNELAQVQELLAFERKAHAETNAALTAEITRLEAQLAAAAPGDDDKCESCNGYGVVGGGLDQMPCTDCMATGKARD